MLAGLCVGVLVVLVLLVVFGCSFVRDLGVIATVVLGVWWWLATGWFLLVCACGLHCLRFWWFVGLLNARFWIGDCFLDSWVSYVLVAGFDAGRLLDLVDLPLRSVCLLVGFTLACCGLDGRFGCCLRVCGWFC